MLVVALVSLVTLTGCGEQPMTPQKPLVDITITDQMRTALDDGVRQILEKIEDGSLPGADALEFQATLDKASSIEKGAKTIRYLFAADGYRGYLEGHPVIFVTVQRKFGRIVQCGAAVPCW